MKRRRQCAGRPDRPCRDPGDLAAGGDRRARRRVLQVLLIVVVLLLVLRVLMGERRS